MPKTVMSSILLAASGVAPLAFMKTAGSRLYNCLPEAWIPSFSKSTQFCIQQMDVRKLIIPEEYRQCYSWIQIKIQCGGQSYPKPPSFKIHLSLIEVVYS